MATTQDNNTLVSQEELNNLQQLEDRFKSLQTASVSLLGAVKSLHSEFASSGKSYKDILQLATKYNEVEKQVVQTQMEEQKTLSQMDTLKKRVLQTETSLTKAVEEGNKVREQEKTLIDISRRAYEMAAQSIDEERKNLVLLQNEQRNTQASLKTLEKEYKQRLITEEQYAQRKAVLIGREQEQGVSIKQLSDTIKYNQQIISTSIGSYANLSAQYSRLKIEINQLSESETLNGYTKAELQEQSQRLYEAMNREQLATGKATLQVGRYDIANKDLVKTLSMLNPAIGRAAAGVNTLNKSFLTLLANPIVAAIAAIVAIIASLVAVFTNSIGAISKTEQGFSDLQKAMAPVRVITDLINNAFKSLGETFVNVTGFITGYIAKLSDMIGLTDNLVEKVEQYNQLEDTRLSLVQRGRDLQLTVAVTERDIAELREKASQQDIYSNKQRLAFIDQVIKKENDLREQEKQLAEERLQHIKDEAEARGKENEAEYIEKIHNATLEVDRLETQRLQRSRANQRERSQILKQITTEEENAIKERQKLARQEIKDQSQLIQFRGQIEADDFNKILNDSMANYEARRQAANNYYETMERVIKEAENAQLEDDNLTKTQRKLIQEKANYEILKLANERTENLLKIEQEYRGKLKAEADTQRAQAIEDLTLQQTEEETALAQSYARGEIKKRDYEQQKNNIQLRYIELRYEEEVRYINELAKLYIDDEKEYEKYQRKLAEVNAKYAKQKADTEVKNAERSAKIREQFERELSKNIQQLALQVNTTVFSLINSRLERQLQALEQEMEAITEFYAKKLEEVEYAEERGLITAEYADAQRKYYAEQEERRQEELNEQKKQLQIQQAKADKKQAAFDVALNTAVAIMAAYKLGPILGSILAGVVAATGALQLATVLSQPLPQYAEGTADHPGGWAVVGDGGKAEMVKTPSGKIIKTPSTPTLMNLPRHTEVLPDYQKAMVDMNNDFMAGDKQIIMLNDGKQVSLLKNNLIIATQSRNMQAEAVKQLKIHNQHARYGYLNTRFNTILSRN